MDVQYAQPGELRGYKNADEVRNDGIIPRRGLEAFLPAKKVISPQPARNLT